MAEELVGVLQTYEMTFPTNQPSSKSFSKSTGIALKTSKEEDVDSDSGDEESNDEELAEAYHQLLVESKKMAKHNRKLRKHLLELEEENNKLKNTNKTLEEERESTLKNNSDLQKKLDEAELTIKSSKDKVGFLEHQYEESHKSNKELTNQVHQLKSDIQKFSSGSKKLDHMLGLGQTNKVGLGYERTYVEKVQTSTSKVSTTLKEKVCHRCGIKGHIKRSCPNKSKKTQSTTPKHQSAPSTTRLPPRNQKKINLSRVPLSDRFSKEQRQVRPNPQPNRIFKSKSQAVWVLKHQRQHQPKLQASKRPTVVQKSKQIKAHVDKTKQPKIRQVWIRKGDIFPCSLS